MISHLLALVVGFVVGVLYSKSVKKDAPVVADAAPAAVADGVVAVDASVDGPKHEVLTPEV